MIWFEVEFWEDSKLLSGPFPSSRQVVPGMEMSWCQPYPAHHTALFPLACPFLPSTLALWQTAVLHRQLSPDSMSQPFPTPKTFQSLPSVCTKEWAPGTLRRRGIVGGNADCGIGHPRVPMQFCRPAASWPQGVTESGIEWGSKPPAGDFHVSYLPHPVEAKFPFLSSEVRGFKHFIFQLPVIIC